MLVRHACDERCATTVNGYRALLRDGDETFQDITLRELLRLWRRGELADEEEQWLADFELRYVNLRASSRWR